MIKKFFVGFFCLTSLACAHAETKSFILSYDHIFSAPATYKAQAQAWLSAYLSQASPEDLSLILNLIYAAWERSQATIIVQTELEKRQAMLSDAAYMIALARQTPALYARPQANVTREHDAAGGTGGADTLSLDALREYHENTSLAYHYALDTLIDQKKLSPQARAAVLTMRREARTAVSQAIASLPRHLDDIIAESHAHLVDAIEKFSHQRLLNYDRGAFGAMWEYIRRFFTRAFFKADKAYAHGGMPAIRRSCFLGAFIMPYGTLWKKYVRLFIRPIMP